MLEVSPGIGKPTSAPPRTVAGVVFRCHKAGVLHYVWMSENRRLICSQAGSETYHARIDGKTLQGPRRGKRFRTLENAMRAAVAAINT